MVRLFVDPDKVCAGPLTLRGEEHHYLSKVRRLSVGDSVVLFDGQGKQATATVSAISAVASELQVESPQLMPVPDFQLTIAPALIKGDRMDLAITKMVELGVAQIAPTITQRTIVRLEGQRAKSRTERFRSLAIAAARQSQNPHPAKIDAIAPLPQVAKVQASQALKLIPCLSQEARPLAQALPDDSPPTAAVLIGPEGGFTAEEVQLAQANGFTPVSLGALTLRAETACIAVASILAFRYGSLV